MTMTSLLARLEQIQLDQEAKEIESMTKLQVIDALLDYIGNKTIRDAVEAILL